MPKSRDLPGQVKQLIRDLFYCLQNTWPSKQFRAELMLGAIHLELLRRRLIRARDLEEWRSIRTELLEAMRIMQGASTPYGKKAPNEKRVPGKPAAHSGRLFN
jgi:hypothetical protein